MNEPILDTDLSISNE